MIGLFYLAIYIAYCDYLAVFSHSQFGLKIRYNMDSILGIKLGIHYDCYSSRRPYRQCC